MRFQFCGNVSCPEWFIAEISVLTKITAVKMKLIFNQLVLLYLENSDISAKVTKLLSGTGLDVYEMNAVVSTLNFILYNSVRFNVPDGTLNKELIDLGLPKENVESITKTYKTSRQKLLEKSTEKMLKLSSGVVFNASIHEFLGSSRLQSETFKPIRYAQATLSFHSTSKNQSVSESFIICEEELDQLIYELEEAVNLIQKNESK